MSHILLLEEYLVIVGLRFNCTVVTSVGVDTVIFIGVQTWGIQEVILVARESRKNGSVFFTVGTE